MYIDAVCPYKRIKALNRFFPLSYIITRIYFWWRTPGAFDMQVVLDLNSFSLARLKNNTFLMQEEKFSFRSNLQECFSYALIWNLGYSKSRISLLLSRISNSRLRETFHETFQQCIYCISNIRIIERELTSGKITVFTFHFSGNDVLGRAVFLLCSM